VFERWAVSLMSSGRSAEWKVEGAFVREEHLVDSGTRWKAKTWATSVATSHRVRYVSVFKGFG